ncbi:MAG TPA: HAD family hydrolase [Gemmatirosa sp.]
MGSRIATTRLVLFDIDGTLIRGNGAAKRAFEASLVAAFGTAGDTGIPFDGKTDPQITRELMRSAGFDDGAIDARMDTVVAGYLERLRAEVAAGTGVFEALPGVPALLDALAAREDVVLGLLTGNVAAGAAVKLDAARIDRARFRVGAYGSDAEHRPDLPGVARRRAAAIVGATLAGADVVVVGDTPADIGCARPIGARSVGVATGRYGVDELAAHDAAAVVPDFCDTAAAVAAVLG